MKERIFDKITDRSGTSSMKWDVREGVLPMWVADMDFETAPAVKEAVIKRAEHGIFGYTYTPDEYFESISDFFAKRHGYRFEVGDMLYVSGIVPASSSMVRRLTHPAEKVLIQAPVFNIFYNSIYNNGRYIVSNDLVLRDGEYTVDFEDMERKLSDPQLTLFILCNPHNPVGKVWTREELCLIGELCKKHGVTVISDEIHCEFTSPKNNYVPFASASDVCRDISVTCLSASKAFNLAGMQAAALVIHDDRLRHEVNRGLNNDEIAEPNAFSTDAYIAAFRRGEEWLDQLVDYVNDNKKYACDYITANIPSLKVIRSQATYLLWVDISSLGIDSVELCDRLTREVGLMLSDGLEYGECGRYFVRINVATQRARVERGLELLKQGVERLLQK